MINYLIFDIIESKSQNIIIYMFRKIFLFENIKIIKRMKIYKSVSSVRLEITRSIVHYYFYFYILFLWTL
jgi:hypothetical protein